MIERERCVDRNAKKQKNKKCKSCESGVVVWCSRRKKFEISYATGKNWQTWQRSPKSAKDFRLEKKNLLLLSFSPPTPKIRWLHGMFLFQICLETQIFRYHFTFYHFFCRLIQNFVNFHIPRPHYALSSARELLSFEQTLGLPHLFLLPHLTVQLSMLFLQFPLTWVFNMIIALPNRVQQLYSNSHNFHPFHWFSISQTHIYHSTITTIHNRYVSLLSHTTVLFVFDKSCIKY